MIAFSLELDRVADEAAHAVVAVLEKQGGAESPTVCRWASRRASRVPVGRLAGAGRLGMPV
jgi:hypothetical protein